MPEIMLLSSAKQNVQTINILEKYQEIMFPRDKAFGKTTIFELTTSYEGNNCIIYTYGLAMWKDIQNVQPI